MLDDTHSIFGGREIPFTYAPGGQTCVPSDHLTCGEPYQTINRRGKPFGPSVRGRWSPVSWLRV
jgi:hypothetical protein